MALIDEIREQPAVVARLIARGPEQMERPAALLRDGGVDGLVIAARGTSDHAAIYAQYVLGAFHRLPVALATPSLAQMADCSSEAARIKRAEEELPRLDVAPPGDRDRKSVV